jgi:hypothetical protein
MGVFPTFQYSNLPVFIPTFQYSNLPTFQFLFDAGGQGKKEVKRYEST